MSRRRASGFQPAIIVSCLFVLVVTATMKWRHVPSAELSPRLVPTSARIENDDAATVTSTHSGALGERTFEPTVESIDIQPQRIGAVLRASDVIESSRIESPPATEPTPALPLLTKTELASDELPELPKATFPETLPKTEGIVAEHSALISSRVKGDKGNEAPIEPLPAIDLLLDDAYQKSRAQALADGEIKLVQPSARSPAFSRIFRELNLRQQAENTPRRNTTADSPIPAPNINLKALPAIAPDNPIVWPTAQRLFDELAELNDPVCRIWAQKVQSVVDALQTANNLHDLTTQQALAELSILTREVDKLQARVKDTSDKSKFSIAAYGLRRRTDIWSAISRASLPKITTRADQIAKTVDRRNMLACIENVRRFLRNSSHAGAWQNYLQLNQVQQFSESSAVLEVNKRTPLASQVLLRCNVDSANAQQRKFLSTPVVQEYQRELMRWMTQPEDLVQLVNALEKFESKPYQRNAEDITNSWLRLRWSTVQEYQAIAEAIELHYRNANLRVSVTENFMNRMIPAMQDVSSPIRDQILGAQVTGLSTSNMSLHVDLVEDQNAIRLQLMADGRSRANTQSIKGPVTLHNFNRSNFVIEKLFVMGDHGVRTFPARAAASGNSSIVGLQTRYDTFPLFGALARRIAQQRAFESRPLQRRIYESRVAQQARQLVDKRVGQQIHVSQNSIDQNVIQPLQQMELDPQTIAMSSSNDRAYYRGRLAGAHQLAAFTARPKETPNSFLSLQMHSSAVNNFLRQMDLDGKRGTIREVMADVIEQFELGDIEIPDEVPEDVEIALAAKDSVYFECDDNRVTFAFRVAGLKTGRKVYRNFEVRASYAPQINGFQCELHRDGVVELAGRRLRGSDELALRAIFVKVFSKNRPIPMVHPEVVKDRRMQDLQIEQFVARDGWIGISVGQKPQPRRSIQNANRHAPRGRFRR